MSIMTTKVDNNNSTSTATAGSTTTTPNDASSSKENENENETYNPKSPPSRQWLYDRIKGQSKYNPTSKPPSCLCYVPRPVGRCPKVSEENWFCRRFGKVGCISPTNERARYWILHVGFWANFIGFLLTIVAAMAISTNYSILKNTSWSRTILTGEQLVAKTLPPKFQHVMDTTNGYVQIDVGLRAVGWDFLYTTNTKQTVTSWEDFCNLPPDNLQAAFEAEMDTDQPQCTVCGQASKSMVISVILSVITFLPSFSTDILRMYSNYDVNCQKTFATIFATLTLIFSLHSMIKYNNACFASFYDGTLDLTKDLTVATNPNDAVIQLDFDWQMGPGLACLYTGTLLKIIDIIANFLVPTPSITRDHKEKWDYQYLNSDESESEEDDDEDESNDGNSNSNNNNSDEEQG